VTTYKIVRLYQDPKVNNEVIKTGLTLEEAQAHCSDPETSSSTAKNRIARAGLARYGPWFDGYDEEES
jgi:hypothetical protein